MYLGENQTGGVAEAEEDDQEVPGRKRESLPRRWKKGETKGENDLAKMSKGTRQSYKCNDLFSLRHN